MRQFAFRKTWGAATAGLLLVGLAWAPRGAAAQGAVDFIQNLGARAIQVAGPAVPPGQRAATFRQLLERNFDLPGAARFVLGPAARELTPEQHQEFMALFRDSLAQSYSKRLGEYAGDPFRVIGERPMGDEIVVASEVQRRNGPPVRIDWHVAQSDGHFLVSDVFVDNVSQKNAQRSQFAAIIERNGGRPDALLAALRQELASGRETGSGSSHRPYAPSPYR